MSERGPTARFQQLHYGGIPVPYTVSWTAEDATFAADCHFAGGFALCMSEARGIGKPRFGAPHAQRQREVIADERCDLCARSLRGRTKVSLSHARSQMHSAGGGEILQVEPLLHRECAAISMRHCPSLRRDIAAGALRVRQINRHAVQMAIMSAEYVAELTGEYRKAIGHAKVQLLAWTDRDGDWLERGSPTHEVARALEGR